MATDNQSRLIEIFDKETAYRDAPDVPGQFGGGNWVSRARCRRSNDPVGGGDTVGMQLYTNAASYDMLVAWSAVELGDPESVKVIRDGAAGKLPANDAGSVAWFNSVARAIDRKTV